jgi:HTH-type transcriptional regulator/antitoxin HipB
MTSPKRRCPVKYLISTPGQLSQALRSVRKAHGLSQDGAGKLVGLLPKTISALENRPGSATIDSLLKLLSALDLELVIAPKQGTDPENTSTSAEDW